MSFSPKKGPTEPGIAPLNFVFACSLCGASFADVYEGHNETVQGLSDGINPKDRLVTRLFLANCGHTFCSSHLEGGGPPFHRDKERPRAPCPVCMKEKGNHEPQYLYSVRGFNTGEYDPLIPPSWFTSPPTRLSGGRELDALTFHYLALVRYCQNSYATRKPLERALGEVETQLATIKNIASEEHTKVLDLTKQNEQLRKENQQLEKEHEHIQAEIDRFEAMKAETARLQLIEQKLEQFRKLNVNPRDLETFVTNKSAIRHYLKLVPMLIEQNEKMQKRLAQLGFAMPLQPIPNFKGADHNEIDCNEILRDNDDGNFGGVLHRIASSHTAGRSTYASGKVGTTSSSPFTRRPMKRQRLDSPLPKDMQIKNDSGQHVMPPPAKPLSRMHSMRHMFPDLRKKFSLDRSSPATQGNQGYERDDRIYDNKRCQTARPVRQQAHEGFHSEPPYMSGALPVENSPELPGSRRLANSGVYENQSDFSFRASSSAKGDAHNSNQRPIQVPHESSYIRLMDVLCKDNKVDLKLKDPRDTSRAGHHGSDMKRQVPHTFENQPGLQDEDQPEHWSSRHDAFHQPSFKSFMSVGAYRPHPQHVPTDIHSNRDHSQPDVGHANSTSGRNYLGNPIESVVSPHFKRGHRQAQPYLPSGPTEAEVSSNHSAIYRSRRPPTSKPQAAWPEPRGLNGLSFFEFPLSSRNRFGKLTQSLGQTALEPVFPPRRHQSRFLNSSGFIRRPETEHPEYWRDEPSTRSQIQTPYAGEPPGKSRTGVNLSSQGRSSYNRIGKVLPTVPSIVPVRSAFHSQSQWKKLHHSGVRSSRNAPSELARGHLGVSSQRMFPVSGRQNIVR